MIELFQVKPYLVKILRIISWDISISNFLCILSQSFTVDNKRFSNAQSTTNLSCSEFSFLFLPEPITFSISPLYLIWSRRRLTVDNDKITCKSFAIYVLDSPIKCSIFSLSYFLFLSVLFLAFICSWVTFFSSSSRFILLNKFNSFSSS